MSAVTRFGIGFMLLGMMGTQVPYPEEFTVAAWVGCFIVFFMGFAAFVSASD